MPLGVTLVDLLRQLRAETGRALTDVQNTSERQHLIAALQRTQSWLAQDQAWPQLLVDRDVNLNASQRYAAYPADLPFDGIETASTRDGANWYRMVHGIDIEQYNAFDSDVGVTSSPILRWQDREGSFEVWPVPPAPTLVRFRGRRALRRLEQDADVCDIDSDLIVLFAAAESLARNKQEDAPLKLEAAQRHLRRLLVRARANKAEPFVLGGGADGTQAQRQLRPGIDFISKRRT